MNLDNITKDELRILIRDIVREVISENKSSKKPISSKHYTQQGNDVENLIGSIPFILLDKKIFQKNMDVVEFADKIGVIISSGEKKKLSEIVGRIIEAIKEFPPNRISLLNQTISHLKKSSTSKKDKASFFEEWDRVIKNMKL
jgi:hypothetical protein